MDSDTPMSSHDFSIKKLEDTCKLLAKDFGFNKVSGTALNKLAAILRSRLDDYAQGTRVMMENAGRTKPTATDVVAALKLKRVDVPNVIEYAKSVKPARLCALPVYPVSDPEASDDAHFKAMYGSPPANRELQHRPENIPSYSRAAEKKIKEEGNVLKPAATKRSVKKEAKPQKAHPFPNLDYMDFEQSGLYQAYEENRKWMEQNAGKENAAPEKPSLKVVVKLPAPPMAAPPMEVPPMEVPQIPDAPPPTVPSRPKFECCSRTPGTVKLPTPIRVSGPLSLVELPKPLKVTPTPKENVKPRGRPGRPSGSTNINKNESIKEECVDQNFVDFLMGRKSKESSLSPPVDAPPITAAPIFTDPSPAKNDVPSSSGPLCYPPEHESLDPSEKKPKDKNSEEYKEYKRQKKERKRKEKEERRRQRELEAAREWEPQLESPPDETTPKQQPLRLRINFGNSPVVNVEPERQSSDPGSPPPNSSPAQHTPLRIRFKFDESKIKKEIKQEPEEDPDYPAQPGVSETPSESTPKAKRGRKPKTIKVEEPEEPEEPKDLPLPTFLRRLLSTDEEDNAVQEEVEEDEALYICPVCSVAYNGHANVVCCDKCEEWFHWHCVGITSAPTEKEWFCKNCLKSSKTSKKRGRKSTAAAEPAAKRRKR